MRSSCRRAPPSPCAPSRSNRLLVVAGGEAIAPTAGRNERLARQDAIFVPAGASLTLRALDTAPLHLISLTEPPADG